MNKRTHRMLLLLCAGAISLLLLPLGAGASVITLYDYGIQAEFPDGWTTVTPDTVAQNGQFFAADALEEEAAQMRADGVMAIAFSPEGDVSMRIIVNENDETARLYHDIERYSTQMRTAIKDRYLNRANFTSTGHRYTTAEWTNRQAQGRMLWLEYSIRAGDETLARGRQTYTVRNGLEIILDIQAKARKLTSEESRAFDQFVAGTTLPESSDMPLLPVGLDITGVLDEETYKQDLTIRGETMKGAAVSVWVLPQDENDPTLIGETTAGSGGTFRIDCVLPGQGEWRLYIKSELEGYATCEEARWISYDPKRLPVTFTSYPEGVWTESQIIISGKTASGVTIQCMEGDETNKKIKTGSDGSFSFKMDRAITGPRTIILSFSKNGFDNRRFEVTFDRQWEREDYAKFLDDTIQSLSYQKLQEEGERYVGRQVKYSGTILDISQMEDRVYIQMGMKQDKNGKWTERLIAVADRMDLQLTVGNKATLYVEVTGDLYTFSEVSLDGDELDIDLPSVLLITYVIDG